MESRPSETWADVPEARRTRAHEIVESIVAFGCWIAGFVLSAFVAD